MDQEDLATEDGQQTGQQSTNVDGSLGVTGGWRCPEAKYKPMPDEFAEFIKALDADDNGTIDFHEFIKWWAESE